MDECEAHVAANLSGMNFFYFSQRERANFQAYFATMRTMNRYKTYCASTKAIATKLIVMSCKVWLTLRTKSLIAACQESLMARPSMYLFSTTFTRKYV